MREPTFTKEYVEDLIAETDEEYRYWDYVFDFGNRQYEARIYLDELNVAYVHLRRGSRWTRLALWRDASRDPQLHTIRRHLRADTGRPIEVHALTPWGGNRGYRQVALH